jgi:predicted nuclease of predicted toxin-antitoxin system
MKLLVDNQLPAQLAAHLCRKGHDCRHVLDLGLEEATDAEIWSRAAREGEVVVSKDEDFIFLANRPDDTGRLVWVRLGNCRNAALIAAFDRVHDDLVRALEAGQRIIEVR